MSETCANCQTTLVPNELYCYHCGQHIISYRKKSTHLVRDYFASLPNAEPKTLKTIGVMFGKPGKLTVDYLDGKRVRYDSPFTLYLTLSFIFFALLAIYAKSNIDPRFKVDDKEWKEAFQKESEAHGGINSKWPFLEDKLEKMSEMNHEMISDALISSFSKAMFVLLPIFALILKMLYIRRKRLYYDHFIFAVHIHAQVMLLLILTLLMAWVFPSLSLGSYPYLLAVVFAYFAMRRVYRQGWIKTAAKLVLLLITYSVIVAVGLLASLVAGVYLAGGNALVS
jgi:hypothetical protein